MPTLPYSSSFVLELGTAFGNAKRTTRWRLRVYERTEAVGWGLAGWLAGLAGWTAEAKESSTR